MKPRIISPWHVILLCALFFLVGCEGWGGSPTPIPAVTQVPVVTVTAVPANIPSLDGYFTGTVAITEPVALGAFDLAIDLSNAGTTLSGTVDTMQTLAFTEALSLQGAITTTTGITPTFRLATTKPSTTPINGRPVRRSFVLTGEVERDGSALRGQYIETIEGYTPEPLNVRGSFLLVRSTGSISP